MMIGKILTLVLCFSISIGNNHFSIIGAVEEDVGNTNTITVDNDETNLFNDSGDTGEFEANIESDENYLSEEASNSEVFISTDYAESNSFETDTLYEIILMSNNEDQKSQIIQAHKGDKVYFYNSSCGIFNASGDWVDGVEYGFDSPENILRGFTTNQDGSGEVFTINFGSLVVNEDLTLYAYWNPAVLITIHSGIEGVEPMVYKATKGSTIELSMNGINERDGDASSGSSYSIPILDDGRVLTGWKLKNDSGIEKQITQSERFVVDENIDAYPVAERGLKLTIISGEYGPYEYGVFPGTSLFISEHGAIGYYGTEKYLGSIPYIDNDLIITGLNTSEDGSGSHTSFYEQFTVNEDMTLFAERKKYYNIHIIENDRTIPCADGGSLIINGALISTDYDQVRASSTNSDGTKALKGWIISPGYDDEMFEFGNYYQLFPKSDLTIKSLYGAFKDDSSINITVLSNDDEWKLIAFFPALISKTDVRKYMQTAGRPCSLRQEWINGGSLEDERYKAVSTIENIEGGSYIAAVWKPGYIVSMADVKLSGKDNSLIVDMRELGDADGNNTVDVADLSLASSYILNASTISDDATDAADYNQDGVIDVGDLSLISSRILSGN